jgi:hypothetical protein
MTEAQFLLHVNIAAFSATITLRGRPPTIARSNDSSPE